MNVTHLCHDAKVIVGVPCQADDLTITIQPLWLWLLVLLLLLFETQVCCNITGAGRHTVSHADAREGRQGRRVFCWQMTREGEQAPKLQHHPSTPPPTIITQTHRLHEVSHHHQLPVRQWLQDLTVLRVWLFERGGGGSARK
jgi:hypothetical protein